MFGMNNPHNRVRDVEALLITSGVKPPKPLAVALDAFHAADYEPPLVDIATVCATIDPADVPALIERAATAAVVAAYVTRPAAEHEPSRHTAHVALAARVAREFVPVVPDVGTGLAAIFDRHADALTADVADMPTRLDLEAASAAGAAVLAAWGRAAECCEQLTALASLRTTLADVYGYKTPIGSPVMEGATRWCEFDIEQTATEIAQVPREHRLDRWVGMIRTPGVTRLRWVPPDEQATRVARFGAMNAEREQRLADEARAQGEAEAAAYREGRIPPRVRPLAS